MCEPSTIIAGAGLALGIGSAVTQHAAQNKAAAANAAEARKALKIQTRDIGIRQVEESIAAQREIEIGQRQAREVSSLLRASAAEAGVAGQSVDALLGDVEADLGRFTQSIEDSTVVTLDQLQRMKTGAVAQAQSRIAAVPRASLLATGLKIGGAALDAASLLASRRPPVE